MNQCIAEDKLAEALNEVFSIVENSGEVLPLSLVAKMDKPTQIIAYLLALRAAVILKYRNSATATAEEIATALGLETQRVREVLSRLKRAFLSRVREGYEIPLPRTPSAIQELLKKRKTL
jgi:hypothetical protein